MGETATWALVCVETETETETETGTETGTEPFRGPRSIHAPTEQDHALPW